MNKLIWNAILIVASVGTTGCIPIPTTSLRSPRIEGRLIEAHTGQPVVAARVALVELPEVHTSTDAAGQFTLRATHNFHLFTTIGICGPVEWPQGESYSFYELTLQVTRTNYETLRVPVRASVALGGETNLSAAAYMALSQAKRVPLRDLTITPWTR
jgi:hypothetical protein